jgi:putative ABC transport system ATP-binding protein
MAGEVYRLRGVRKHREKAGAVFELLVPRLTIRSAEFVAVVGSSGCGKSTLLDLLGLVLRPTSAQEFSMRRCDENGLCSQVEVSGLSESQLSAIRRSQLGYVLQTGGLLPYLSVRENILLPCRLAGAPGSESMVLNLTRRLGISDQLEKKPQHLSVGQRQRVAIARALAHRPPVVLADEPTAAVDKVTALEIRREFQSLVRQLGVSLVMVTHDLELIQDVADRVFQFHVDKPSPHLAQATLLELGQGES